MLRPDKELCLIDLLPPGNISRQHTSQDRKQALRTVLTGPIGERLTGSTALTASKRKKGSLAGQALPRR